jgi:ABC-type lipoprotein export system ATPase subunit
MNDANPQTPFQEAVCGGQWKVLSPFVAGNEEQTNAVLHVLKSKDLVTSIRGPAGSGKTTMMQEAVRAVAALSGKDVFRQQIAALRDAVYDLSAGKTESGFSKLDAFGAIHEVEDNAERLEAIANQHMAAVREGKSSLIVAPTHAECRAISEVVRVRQKKEGFLSGEEHARATRHRAKLLTRSLSACPWPFSQTNEAQF